MCSRESTLPSIVFTCLFSLERRRVGLYSRKISIVLVSVDRSVTS